VDEYALNNPTFRPAILIPVYNHEDAIKHTLQAVMGFTYPILLVDDGSDLLCQNVLSELATTYSHQVHLLRLQKNRGKGAAVKAGLKKLAEMGYTHGLQIDADGQHNFDDIPQFMHKGQTQPDSIIAGHPLYDESISKGRFYGRYLTHVWVWINTLSFTIKDSMCGFRLYPLTLVNNLLDKEPCGDRMDFDPEIIVRWLWRNGRIEDLPTQVHYPTDGVSHFKLLQDNALISWMHTRLFFGMLKRMPHLIWRKF